MKYIIALLLGTLVGVLLFFVALLYNPLSGGTEISPLSFADNEQVVLTYSGIPSENILYSNDGESRAQPYPDKVLQLWEPPIRKTSVMTTLLRDALNQVSGIGIKISSLSESTDLLKSDVSVDSVWYLYLPERGSVFLQQKENRWGYVRDIMAAAYRSSAKTWKGSWNGNLTAGPGSLGTARVTGGSGEFAGRELLGVESLSIQAWSVEKGALAATGTLTLEFQSSSDVPSQASGGTTVSD